MTLAEVYEALGKLDGGEALASTIKAEISKINAEAAKQRTAKNASDAKITELEAKVQELTEKGTGDQTAVEKMQKQLDELTKKYDAAEKARGEEHAKRVHADITQQTVAALTKGNAASPAEIAKILIPSIAAEDDGSYKFTNAKGEKVSIEDGTAAWLKDNSWAVKNNQNAGSGGGKGGNGGQGSGAHGGNVTLASAIAAQLNNN